MIVWSDDRLTAIKKSIDSIKKFPIFGIPLNTQLLEKILNLNEFKNGNMNTGLLEDRASELKIDSKTKNLPTSAAIVHLINSIQVNKCFSDSIGNFRIWKNSINPIVHSINLGQLTTKSALVISDERVFVNGSENPLTFQVRTEQGLFEEICLPKVRTVLNDKIIFETDEELVFFRYGIRTYFLFRGVNGFADIYKEDSLNNAVNANYRSPMPGKIVSITVQKGNVYSEGDLLAIVEAMKMENQIRANSKILIDDILFNEGELIKPEDDIFKFSNLK
jgi:acetyl/propionyl-CoA carboxylase alpha subunit